MLDWLHLPVAASAHAGDIDRVLVLTHWLMVVLFAGWAAYLLYVLVRFRRRRQPTASYTGPRGRWSLWAEGGVLAAEVVLLVVFSTPVWNARIQALPSEAESLVVRVVAEQFAWNVHYPGPDGVFGLASPALISPDNPLGLDPTDAAGRDDLVTINQLAMPVDRPVIVHLSSKDVIHSFALPEMRVKQDAIPGTLQTVWFTPTRIGSWEIICSQLCGLAHYRMRGFYDVMTADDFDAWLAEEAAAQAAVVQGDAVPQP